MRRFTGLLLVLVLVSTVPAFAAPRAIPVAPYGVGPVIAPATIDNDDSCDIGVFPAATLLLPYFEVDVNTPPASALTTLFTITNVTRLPQIAHVTIWTDWSFPILDFNIFLTGYDVQSINLRDVLNTIVAPGPGLGGTSATDRTLSPLPTSGQPGAIPSPVNANPNINPSAVAAGGSCSQLPGRLPPNLVAAVVTALTQGIYNPGFVGTGCGSRRVGSPHANAVGYLTIDVAATCSVNLADNPIYFLTEALYDNVLTGDYQTINPNPSTGNFAQASPMVHIRAIPEGGAAGLPQPTELPNTFYSRVTSLLFPGLDRRQPLPSLFAARWIDGGPGGYRTEYKIWREGVTLGTQSCNTALLNANLEVTSIIRFDEKENSFGYGGGTICSPCPEDIVTFPETSRTSVDSGLFPPNGSGDLGGWMYMNLDHGAFPTRASQNWVIVSMAAEGRFSVDFDATMLGNGCTPRQLPPNSSAPVGPAMNANTPVN